MSTIASRKRKLAVDSLEHKIVYVHPLEHKIERLYLIAHNFNERFIALETAIARLQNITAAPPAKRARTKKSAD
jgi:hypothetical protein